MILAGIQCLSVDKVAGSQPQACWDDDVGIIFYILTFVQSTLKIIATYQNDYYLYKTKSSILLFINVSSEVYAGLFKYLLSNSCFVNPSGKLLIEGI